MASTSVAKKTPEPNLKHALTLVKELMAIPGTSGQEGRVAEFIKEKLRQAGASSKDISDALKARYNDDSPLVREHVQWALKQHEPTGKPKQNCLI